MKRFRCNKCGITIFAEESPLTCTEPMPERTSGICGGGYIEEYWVDFDEWKKMVEFMNRNAR